MTTPTAPPSVTGATAPPALRLATRLTALGAMLTATLSVGMLSNEASAGPNAGLADPTRPPMSVQAAAAAGAAPRHPATAAAAAQTVVIAASAVPGTPAPLVQAIQITPRGATALLDGRMVHPGDAVGDRIVSAIERDAVLLRNRQGGVERLTLLAGAVKQPVGSIVLSRTASYTATPPADSDGAGANPEQRNATGEVTARAANLPPLAARTRP